MPLRPLLVTALIGIILSAWATDAAPSESTHGIPRLVSSIPGVRFWGVDVNPSTNRIYGTNNDQLLVIDGATETVLDSVPVGPIARGVAVDHVRNKIYVANRGNNTVTVVDGATHATAAPISVGGNPTGIAINVNTNRVYTGNYATNDVSVVDASANPPAGIATISVGQAPHGVAVNPSTNRIYVAHQASSYVSVIDGGSNAVLTTVPYGGGTAEFGLALNPNTNRIYVTATGSDRLFVIDGSNNTVMPFINVGDFPTGVAVDPAANLIYVANQLSASVSVINGATNAPAGTVSVGAPIDIQPLAVGVNPVTNQAYVGVATFTPSIPVICGDILPGDNTNTDSTLNSGGASVPSDVMLDACDEDDDNDSFGDYRLPSSNSACPSSFAVAIFRDCIENYLPTDRLDNCSNDPSHSANPLDMDNNAIINVTDVNYYKGKIPAVVTSPGLRRLDLDANGLVNLLDVNFYQGRLPSTCS